MTAPGNPAARLFLEPSAQTDREGDTNHSFARIEHTSRCSSSGEERRFPFPDRDRADSLRGRCGGAHAGGVRLGGVIWPEEGGMVAQEDEE